MRAGPAYNVTLSVALFFALGLLAKPMIITLPFLLLLADYWPLQRLGVPGVNAPGSPSFGATFFKLAMEKVPLLLLCAASAGITLYAQWIGGALGSTVVLPMKYRVPNAIYSYLAYILKGFWPLRLAVFYPHPVDSLPLWKPAAAALLLLIITAAVWRYREKRYLVTGWLWYLVTLVPVIGIVQVGRQAMADRYAYVPFIGLFVIAVWLTADFAPRIHVTEPALVAVTLGSIIRLCVSLARPDWLLAHQLFAFHACLFCYRKEWNRRRQSGSGADGRGPARSGLRAL